jgi:hypothetical protein
VNFQIFVIQKIFDHKSGSANRIADCRKDECNGKTVSKPEEKILSVADPTKLFSFFHICFGMACTIGLPLFFRKKL